MAPLKRSLQPAHAGCLRAVGTEQGNAPSIQNSNQGNSPLVFGTASGVSNATGLARGAGAGIQEVCPAIAILGDGNTGHQAGPLTAVTTSPATAFWAFRACAEQQRWCWAGGAGGGQGRCHPASHPRSAQGLGRLPTRSCLQRSRKGA